MARLVALLALVLAVPVAARAADDRSPLARARQLYNMRDFDAAIAAAETPTSSSAMGIIAEHWRRGGAISRASKSPCSNANAVVTM